MHIDHLMSVLPENIDSALVITPQNRKYFTSFSSSDGFLLVTRSGSIFFTDSRYIEAAKNQINCCEVTEGIDVFSQMKNYLTDRKVKTIALEASGITVSQFNRLKSNPAMADFNFVCDASLDTAINTFRSIKSPEEVDNIRKAQSIAESGFLHILNYIKPGISERDIQLELDYFMLKNGAEALSFDTIAVSGIKSSMPHGVPDGKLIENGDFITMDFGAVVNGYHSDMTRTVAVGSVSDEQREIYTTVLKAQLAALDFLKEGVSCFNADKAARDVISAAGHGEHFGHGTGHGVGIEIHEQPNLSPKSKQILERGNIVTVEPGIYIPGKFGVRIEDMALITESGCINLTDSEKKLIVL